MANQKRAEPARDIVTLADLAPSREVRGGRGRQVFGASAVDAVRNARHIHEENSMAGSKKTKDQSPKSSPKGGAKKLAGNDNVTLVRAAKPAIKKDMTPKSNPKGGKKAR